MDKHPFSRILAPAAFLPLLWTPSSFALKVEYLPAPFPASAPAAGEAGRGRAVASGRALVKFSSGLSSSSRRDLLSSAGFELVRDLHLTGWSVAGLPAGMSVASALPALRSLAGVLAAEPSGVYRAAKIPRDPFRADQYGLARTDAFRAWDFETGLSTRVTVAVLDTGIDGSHPDLAPKLAVAGRFFDPDNPGVEAPDSPPTPACGHATNVAGVAAAATDNSYGIAGMSWGAGLLSLKVFSGADCFADCSDKAGPGSCKTDDATIISAINYAVSLQNSPATGRIVINMSLGQSAPCGSVLQSAVDNAVNGGLVLVASAGNDPAGVGSPANCLGVIPVGATDMNDRIAGFSARGSEMLARGVAAPGVNIYTAAPGPAFAFDSGTSLAAPLVAGLAALIVSTRPALTPAAVGDFIRNSADDLGTAGPDPVYGFGRINAYKALLSAVNGNFSAFVPELPRTKAYAFPNPYYPGAGLLSFVVPDGISGAELEINIYTAEGEKIKKLSSRTWDGHNEVGRAAASGVYIFFMKTEKGKAKGKFAILR